MKRATLRERQPPLNTSKEEANSIEFRMRRSLTNEIMFGRKIEKMIFDTVLPWLCSSGRRNILSDAQAQRDDNWTSHREDPRGSDPERPIAEVYGRHQRPHPGTWLLPLREVGECFPSTRKLLQSGTREKKEIPSLASFECMCQPEKHTHHGRDLSCNPRMESTSAHACTQWIILL